MASGRCQPPGGAELPGDLRLPLALCGPFDVDARGPTSDNPAPFSRVGLFLLKVLLFKLLFMSGVVKLTSHDESWWNLTALDYHYWTQPLPTVIGWWSDQHPEWFKKFSVAFCLVVEIVAPFFIWAPRRLRHVAAGLLIALQLAIAATGNYCFFNLLAIALCLLLFDDRFLRMEGRAPARPAAAASRELRPPITGMVVLVLTLPINAMFIFSAIKPEREWPRPISAINDYIEPFRIINGYGLFRVMTKSRPEIIIEGSADGNDWLPYEFKWKPGALDQAPRWVAPHQPRLDWQMWFAALGSDRERLWFDGLMKCLLRNTPAVTRLLAHNPFPEAPPRYVRAQLYEYRFTTWAEHRATGAWWKREERGEYLPAISLEDFDRR